MIEVTGEGNLTILDSSEGKTGQITGGKAEKGGGILNGGTLNFHGGTILACEATDAGGIFNSTGATLNITGGIIDGCVSGAGGGAVVNYGTASISGMTFMWNEATTRGGAIWSNSDLTVDNCMFHNNIAQELTASNGGAIHLSGGTATLTDVTMEQNSSNDAGGIYVSTGATLNLGGKSTLKDNSSLEHGGGGIVNEGTVNLSGEVTITKNSCKTDGGGIWSTGTLTMQGDIRILENENDDVFLKKGKVITVTGPLTCGKGSIRVKMEKMQERFTSGYEANNPTNTEHFSPSKQGDGILMESGEAWLMYGYMEARWDGSQVVYEKKLVDKTVSVVNLADIHQQGHGLNLDGDSNWYVMDGTVEMSEASSIFCDGNEVHLILYDHSSITASGVLVRDGTTLHIHSQSYGDDMGKLSSTSHYYYAGICLEGNNASVVIHGGDIAAKGIKHAAGIGGIEGVSGGAITIYGGNIEANGTLHGSGIGGGSGAGNGPITIYGGTVTANGKAKGAGIGGGGGSGQGGPINIYGGSVIASADPTSTESLSHGGAGIGGGGDGNGGIINIYGGEVQANGANGGAAIGGGGMGNGGTVSISGGKVTATSNDSEATGIGGGGRGNGGKVTISGGEVKVYAAGVSAIGTSSGHSYADITITGGTVDLERQTGWEPYWSLIGYDTAYTSSLIFNLGDYMKVETGDPVPTAQRKSICLSEKIHLRISTCDHSFDSEGECIWCMYHR